MGQLLELYDLDGTLTTEDVVAALEGKGCREILEYVIAASEHVSQKTGIPVGEVFDGIKTAIIGTVLPNRLQAQYWAEFPASDKSIKLICPAADHFFLVKRAVEHFLNERLQVEGSQSESGKKISAFLDSLWTYPLFQHASDVSLQYAHIDEDAVQGLEQRIRAGALAAVISNSTTDKIKTLLERAGFGSHITQGRVERGKIGMIGDAKKWLVDVTIPVTDENILDLSRFDLPVPLDLRRSFFQRRVQEIAASVRAECVLMVSDIPELDLFPLEIAFERVSVEHAVRVNPVSVPQSIEAARVLLGARISTRFSELVDGL